MMSTGNKQSEKTVSGKLQHLVFYVNDLKRSKEFYMHLLDLQFSALNHPDSSAAMKLSKQEMHFFSFGFYHHDICMVKHHQLQMDNYSMMHYTMVVPDTEKLDTIQSRLSEKNIPYRTDRLIASATRFPGEKVLAFQDPDHHWIEIIYKPSPL